jgi:hypothetical protein
MTLAHHWRHKIALPADELTGWRFATTEELPTLLPPRLSRRVLAAIAARSAGQPAYLEHGAQD